MSNNCALRLLLFAIIIVCIMMLNIESASALSTVRCCLRCSSWGPGEAGQLVTPSPGFQVLGSQLWLSQG